MNLQERIIRAFPDLFEDAWKHKAVLPSTAIKAISYSQVCSKCGDDFNIARNTTPCTVPDPITIDDNLAMKLFREVFEELPFKTSEALLVLYMSNTCDLHMLDSDDKTNRLNSILWGLVHATPEQLAEAACIAKEATQPPTERNRLK